MEIFCLKIIIAKCNFLFENINRQMEKILFENINRLMEKKFCLKILIAKWKNFV